MTKRFDLIYADPAWPYKGTTAQGGSEAANHYALMSWEQLSAMPVRDVCKERATCLMWATSPFLDRQIKVMQDWGFHYRGVAFVWVKTRADGKPIGAKGGVPTFVKPTCEYVLLGTTCKTGRATAVHDFAVSQVQMHPAMEHSRKPDLFRHQIDRVVGTGLDKLELFARRVTTDEGWYQSGLELDGTDYTAGSVYTSSAHGTC